MIEPVKRPSNRSLKSLSNVVLPKFWSVIVVWLLGLMLVNVFTVSTAAAAQQSSDVEIKPDENSLSLVITEQETGEPAGNVDVQFYAVLGDQKVRDLVTSDKDGQCELSWNGNPHVRYLHFTTSKPNYVPVHRGWKSDRSVIDLPEQVKINLVKGSQISGVVLNEAGAPIANATVRITLRRLESKGSQYVFTAAELQTDELGKWSWDSAPVQTERMSVRVTHPDFKPDFRRAISLGKENVFTLKQGLKVSGRVVDMDGKPIENATATLGMFYLAFNAPTALTDADGRFELLKCDSGASAVTIQAKSFAPQQLKIDVSSDLKPLEFQLRPGNRMRVRVVDFDGAPIDNAAIRAGKWLGQETIKMSTSTDANGEFVWEDAPPEPVEFAIQKSGYMRKQNVSISPSDEAHIVTLTPNFTITGSVKSKESGDLVNSFKIISGHKFKVSNKKIYWSPSSPVEQANGRYEFAFERPHNLYYLKVIASGYEPKISRAFKPDEGLVKYDFTLDDGWSIRGILRRPDGTSVSNGKIAYLLPHSPFQLTGDITVNRDSGIEIVTTDRNGRFTITPSGRKNEAFMLFATEVEGIAIYKFDGADKGKASHFDPSKILTLKLEPWGKLEGTVYSKGQPDAKRKVSFWSAEFLKRYRPFQIRIRYSTTSDFEGKFEFARLPAVKGIVSKSVAERRGGRSFTSTRCWQTPVTIIAKETASIDVSKLGVVVNGFVTTDKQPNFTIDWTLNKYAEIKRGNRFTAKAPIDTNGNFQIPDVPPGRYELTVTLSANNQPAFGRKNVVGNATVKFTVKRDQTEPLNLGEVVVKLRDKS